MRRFAQPVTTAYKWGMIGALGPKLTLALAGLDRAALGVPDEVGALLAWARGTGFGAVQLDGTWRGLRARDLSRSARRDLAGLIRRTELVCTGIDLFVPTEHFADPMRVDRAVGAVTGATELAADLSRMGGGAGPTGGAVVSLTLPGQPTDSVLAAIADRADRCGVMIADHAWPPRAPTASGEGPIGVGLDPAVLLVAGEDPGVAVSRLGRAVASARLRDAGPDSDRASTGVSGARFDPLAYAIALTTAGYQRHVVADLRGLGSPADAAARMIETWSAG